MNPLVYNTKDFQTLICKLSSEFVDQYLNYMVYGCSFNKMKEEYIKINKLEDQNLENNQNYKIFEFITLTIKKDFNNEFSEYKDLGQMIYNCVYCYFYKLFNDHKQNNEPVLESNIYDDKKINKKLIICLNKYYLSLKTDFQKEIKKQIKILTSNFLFYKRYDLYYKFNDIYIETFNLVGEMDEND